MKQPRILHFTLITSIFALFFIAGCEKKDFSDNMIPKEHMANCHSAMVTDIIVPNDIRAGQAFVVDVKFVKPTPCDSLLGFQLHQAKNTFDLDVCLLLSEEPCITVIEIAQSAFTLTLPLAGNYTLSYLGTEGEESISFTVNP